MQKKYLHHPIAERLSENLSNDEWKCLHKLLKTYGLCELNQQYCINHQQSTKFGHKHNNSCAR